MTTPRQRPERLGIANFIRTGAATRVYRDETICAAREVGSTYIIIPCGSDIENDNNDRKHGENEKKQKKKKNNRKRKKSVSPRFRDDH